MVGRWNCSAHAQPEVLSKRGRIRWRQTEAGTAWILRFSRGYPAPEARAIAAMIHGDSCCALCGIPGDVVRAAYRLRTLALPGPRKNNARLTVDRVDPWQPHRLANTRLACWPCNRRRGRAMRGDDAVSAEGRAFWAATLPPRLRGWLAAPFTPPTSAPASIADAWG